MKRSLVALASLVALLPGCGKDDPGLTTGATTGEETTTTGDPSDAEFGPEQSYPLRLNEQQPPPLQLQMSREEVADLFGEQASQITLLSLDPSPLLANTLDALRNACGTDWQLDSPDPNHNCSLTELGQSFGYGGVIPWQLSAEYALVRLLTMTPANVDVTGTTSEHLADLVDALASVGEIDPFGQVLADALGLENTQPMVSQEALLSALMQNLVTTHPEVGADGKLEVTLADALADMAPLAERYGPTDDHPGIIAGEVSGEVFGPGFKMIVSAGSNLRIVDGVDGSGGKGYATVVDDRVGPSYDDELEFDFNDPDRFRLEGLAEDLAVDLRVQLLEHPEFVASCVGDPACQSNLPESPLDDASVWTIDPWLLERTVTTAAKLDYDQRVYWAIYVNGLAQVHIGQEGAPPGWVHYEIENGLGDPPGDQYLWEMVLEVAQVALHHTPWNDFDEGDASVAFTVRDVPVGLSGEEATEAVRPFLQEQAGLLSDLLLGNYREENDAVDVVYRRAEDGVAYLYFTAAEDLVPGVEYPYGTPGLFSDPDLTQKISSLQIDGVRDETHEKLALGPGETVVYFADDGGQTYRLRAVMPAGGDSEIEVFVAARVD
ncbi:hypothetical protein [Paraliomyxa miuraensis]|uniref:hypothetical protein n=1 Tax=Paraliomyxa miuraensis TaxID=376150 RepID=UPI0022509CAA|nr:hypothetical protein [Paraliomyxa miuraensis]MCX4244066.1 hypothetical protein [Paraliomyxa miuraensis]